LGHIPSRYPGTENLSDGSLRLARKTEWLRRAGETFLGCGQRVLATSHNEYPLLECRHLEMTLTAPPDEAKTSLHA
jgi:type VI secretion system protein ImpE